MILSIRIIIIIISMIIIIITGRRAQLLQRAHGRAARGHPRDARRREGLRRGPRGPRLLQVIFINVNNIY